MAYLSDGRRDRAQILLLTAFVLGVMFVALALILNSAIFTENLASRGETTGGDEFVQYHNDLKRGAGNILFYENRNVSGSDTHADVANRVGDGVGDTNEILMRKHAKSGAISDVTVDDRTDGARIYQTNSSRNLTSGDAQNDWMVVEDVGQTREYWINVSAADSSCTLFSDCFVVEVSNASHSWRMSVVDTGTDLAVEVENVTGATDSCTVAGSRARINITGGTVGGEDCPALGFGDAPTDQYDVEFQNADKIHGSYSAVVDNATVATAPPSHFSTSSNPAVDPALYNTTLAYEYETAAVTVDTELTVAPGEPDE